MVSILHRFSRFTICLLLCHLNTSIATPITCETRIGPSSGNADDALSTVSCSSSQFTMLSCGMKTITSSEFTKQGSWVSGPTCHAQNAYEGDGVYAYGRCCDLSSYDFTCTQYESSQSGSTDGNTITRQCSNTNQVLMGCSIKAVGNNLDGCYPGTSYPQTPGALVSSNNICTAVVSISNEPVYSNINCCNSLDNRYSFECHQKWSSASNTNVGAITSVSCPSTDDYFMTSCSGIGLWANMNQYTIENNICYARNGVNSYPVYAIAICCRLIIASTSDPSVTPSTNPTNNPTSSTPTKTPSLIPSLNPSQNPSVNPTSNPTRMPSSQTSLPTSSPSSNPSASPSSNPSIMTFAPTTKPKLIVGPDMKTTNVNEGRIKTSMNFQETNDHKIDKKNDNLLWYQYLIYIIIGFCVILIFIFVFIVYNKKRKNQTKHQKTTEMINISVSSASSGINTGEMKSNIDMIDYKLSNVNTSHSIGDENDNEIAVNQYTGEQIYDNNNDEQMYDNDNDEKCNEESADGLYGNKNGIMTTKGDETANENKDNDDELYSNNEIQLTGNTTKYGDNINTPSPFNVINTSSKI